MYLMFFYSYYFILFSVDIVSYECLINFILLFNCIFFKVFFLKKYSLEYKFILFVILIRKKI